VRPEHWLVVAFALLLLAATLAFNRGRIVKARRRIQRLKEIGVQECRLVRAAGRHTLHQRRELSLMERAAEAIQRDCEQAQAQVRELEAVDRRLYVLDERRTNADQSWVAVISHANFRRDVLPDATPRLAVSWVRGRRFIVWAVDQEKAQQKVWNRYPPARGFVLLSLDLLPQKPETALPPAASDRPVAERRSQQRPARVPR